MSSSIEDRVRRLEESRYRTIGELYVLRTMLLSAWTTLVHQSSAPPAEVIAQLKSAWLPASPQVNRVFPGTDPSEIAAFSHEYEVAIARLFTELERAVLGPPRPEHKIK